MASLSILGGIAMGATVGALAGRLASASRSPLAWLALLTALATVALEVTWLAGAGPSLCFALAAIASAGLAIAALGGPGHAGSAR